MAISDEKLLEAGIRSGLIEARQLDALRLAARKKQLPLLRVVQAHYRFPLSVLYRAVAEQSGLAYIDIISCKIADSYFKKIPPSLIRRIAVLPVVSGEQVYLAVANPFERASIDTIQRLLGQPLPLAVVDASALSIKIARVLENQATAVTAGSSVAEATDLVNLLDVIISEAYLNRASDIHLVIEKTGLRVRLRIDGKLHDYPVAVDLDAGLGIISRIKVLSDLDISEQRQPQDGGFSYYLAAPIDKSFNIRVATAPIRLGERVTMRLLAEESNALSLIDLGMASADLVRFRQAIAKPYGLILLTGPTGSGKSTTLCAALQEINQPDINIMTVENPIEYVIAGVSQLQTGSKVSFAAALRSFLRHDPDVLMVGEIRDAETADVAVKAAMTGHMVFSTLHTNNAVSAVTRLIDIGCEPFLIGSTVTAVIAQRLVRQLCVHCRTPRLAHASEFEELGVVEAVSIFQPVGCSLCQGSGYKGRLGLFETLWFDDQLARMVTRGADEEMLEENAGKRLQYMWEDGIRKVLQGLTTLDELRNVATYKTHPVLREG